MPNAPRLDFSKDGAGRHRSGSYTHEKALGRVDRERSLDAELVKEGVGAFLSSLKIRFGSDIRHLLIDQGDL